MFNIKIADVSIGIENKFEYIKEMCRDYLTSEAAEFSVSVTDAEIARENDENEAFPEEYLEALAIYRKIAEKLSDYDAFLMHGVLMNAKNHGVLLTAESGTGKSTHAALWCRLLGEECHIVNGDKPLIRILDGCAYAYGTPWCGKEGINKNERVRLCDICFVSRADENETFKTPKGEILQNLLPSIHFPENSDNSRVFDAVDKMARQVKFYHIRCNMDISAAETAYNEIIK